MPPLANPNRAFQENVAKPITPDALQPQQPISMPQQPYQAPSDDTYAAAIQAFDPNALFDAADAPSAAEQTQDDISSQLLASIQKLGGESAFRAQKETDLGLDLSRKQLTDVTSQLITLQNEAKAIPLQSQQNAEGRGVTSGGLAPITNAALRTNAIKSLSLSSVASTLQGNIALAEQQADKAVELEFAPERTRLEYLTKAYEMNRDRVEREDKKRAARLDFMLNERSRLLKQAEEDRKIVFSWAAEAAKVGGADQLTINRALQSQSPKEALAILAPFFQDPMAKDQALADLDYKRAQTAYTNEQIGLVRAQIDVAKANAAKTRSEIEAGASPAQAALERKNEVLSLAQGLRANDATGKSSAVGASFAKLLPFGQSLGLQGNRAAFEARVATLKANLTLDNLKLLKGPMSDKDLAFLQAVGSSLDTSMSEANFNAELDKVIAKLNGAPAAQIVTAPDGTQVQIID